MSAPASPLDRAVNLADLADLAARAIEPTAWDYFRSGAWDETTLARSEAAVEKRTIAGQIEYWAMVGRAALDNPDLPVTFVAESLASMAEPREQATPFIPRSRKP